MKRAMLGGVVLLASMSLSAKAQEGSIPPHRLAQLGLCCMQVVPDGYVDARRVPPPPEFVVPHVAHGQTLPPVIGVRQMVVLNSLRAQDERWLKQYAWRTAHRARGFSARKVRQARKVYGASAQGG